MMMLKKTLSAATTTTTTRRCVHQTQRVAAAAAFSTTAKLPELKYQYGALEPAISGQIMEIHHSKHHQTYVTNYNAASEQYAVALREGNIQQMVALEAAIRFNGGGHVNHSIFWTNLAPPSEGGGVVQDANSELMKRVAAKWGDLESFKKTFNATTAGVQGSGWGWLVYNKQAKDIEIITKPNQDPVVGHQVPLLGIDVWEHAYYLQYKNVRPDYLNAIWKVVNWANVEERYAASKK